MRTKVEFIELFVEEYKSYSPSKLMSDPARLIL
jgi:hypothetical protein